MAELMSPDDLKLSGINGFIKLGGVAKWASHALSCGGFRGMTKEDRAAAARICKDRGFPYAAAFWTKGNVPISLNTIKNGKA
jgi:hypothetical protein